MPISETIAPVTVHVIRLASGTNKGAYAHLQQNQTCDQPGYFWRVNDNNKKDLNHHFICPYNDTSAYCRGYDAVGEDHGTTLVLEEQWC